MRAKLFCRTGELAGLDHDIDQAATIGRGAQNSLRLGASVVSQAHARISYDADLDAFVLEDLHSRNGTRLDGVPVQGRRRLGPVHVVTLGDRHDLIFVAAPSTTAPVARPSREADTPELASSDTRYELASVLEVPVLTDLAPDSAGEPTVHERPAALDVPSFEGARRDKVSARHDDAVASGETVFDLPAALDLPSFGTGPGGDAASSPPVPGSGSRGGGQVVLRLTMADGASRRVVLGEGRHDIGRSAECAVCIDDRTLTRRHAVVTVTLDTHLQGRRTAYRAGLTARRGQRLVRRPGDRHGGGVLSVLAARGESRALRRDGRCAGRTRREEGKYRQYLTDAQRRSAGCSARRMQRDFHHGLLGLHSAHGVLAQATGAGQRPVCEASR